MLPPAAPAPSARPADRTERRFLAGPSSRRRELRLLWTVVREFLHGFRGLRFVGPCVSVFGSARITELHQLRAVARRQAQELDILKKAAAIFSVTETR